MSWIEVGDFSIDHTLTDSNIVTNEREFNPPPPPGEGHFGFLVTGMIEGFWGV